MVVCLGYINCQLICLTAATSKLPQVVVEIPDLCWKSLVVSWWWFDVVLFITSTMLCFNYIIVKILFFLSEDGHKVETFLLESIALIIISNLMCDIIHGTEICFFFRKMCYQNILYLFKVSGNQMVFLNLALMQFKIIADNSYGCYFIYCF